MKRQRRARSKRQAACAQGREKKETPPGEGGVGDGGSRGVVERIGDRLGDRERFRGLSTQGPRGLGLGSRNLADHPTNVGLGVQGPLFREFVVFSGRVFLKQGVCQHAGARGAIVPLPHSDTPLVAILGASAPALAIQENFSAWLVFTTADCKKGTNRTAFSQVSRSS